MQERKLLENVVFMRLKERCFLKSSSGSEQDLSGASFAGQSTSFFVPSSKLLRISIVIIRLLLHCSRAQSGSRLP